MKHVIEHINLELDVPNGNHVNGIEQKTLNSFKDKVLEPLDAYLASLPISPLRVKQIQSIDVEVSIDTISKMVSAYENVLEQLKTKIASQDFETAVQSIPLDANMEAKQILLDYLKTGKLPFGLSVLEFKKVLEKQPFLKIASQLEFNINSNYTARLLECYSFEEISQYYIERLSNIKSFFQNIFKEELLQFEETSKFLSEKEWNSSNIFSLVFNTFKSLDRPLLKSDYEIRVVNSFLNSSRKSISSLEYKKSSEPFIESEETQQNKKRHQNEIVEISNEENKPAIKTKYTIDHAGLFLLHPFLKNFFEEQKLLTAQYKIINNTKVAQLLFYIATGQDMPKDYELLTEKIILGLTATATISINRPLTDIEKEACDELLQNIINQWEALKSSGSQFLRQLFLQRKGTALKNEQNWIITIEKQAQDVLIDKMPWGLGIVKLPGLPSNFVTIFLRPLY